MKNNDMQTIAINPIPKGTQLDLVDHGVFNGKSYEPLYNGYANLRGINLDLFELMRDGKYRSLDEIQAHFKNQYQQTSISAGLRNLRKQKFGGHTLNKKRAAKNQFTYQLITSLV